MEDIRQDRKRGLPPEGLISMARRSLEHKYTPAIIAGLAVVIMLPALNAGLIMDDLFHRVRLVQPSQLPRQLNAAELVADDAGTAVAAMRDMYSFVRTKQDLERQMEFGMCPWWTAEGLRAANWRPLDSFTHWLDYRLFGDWPLPMHVHNIIWFAGLVFLLTLFYRKLMAPAWMAAVAAILYTIDESNYFPVMWVANRNLPLALFFSILTLLLHHKWRHHGSFASGVAAPLTLLLSLLSTEAGVATFAYLFAYALIIEHGSRTSRIVSLAPSLIVIIGWRMIYNSLGYGAAGSGFLIDPGHEPMRYLQAVLERAPVLFAAQWGPTPADAVYIFSGYARRCYLLAAVLFAGLILAALLPLLRKDRVARFWFVAMLLCILPICASSPMNRNLLFAAIGAFGLMAQFIGGLFTKRDWAPRSRFWRVPAWMICVILVFIHTGFAAFSRGRTPRMLSFFFERLYSTAKVDPSVDLTDKTLVVINAPNPFQFLVLPPLRAYEDEPLPDRMRLLAPGLTPLKFTRTGDKTLLVEARAGNIMSVDESRRDFKPSFAYFFDHFNSLFRPRDMPFEVGQKTVLRDMSAEVVAVDGDGRPAKVLFEFAASLDDPALVWLQWTWKDGLGSYSKFEVPAVGGESRTNGPFSDTLGRQPGRQARPST